MPINAPRPLNDVSLDVNTSSIGASPVAAVAVAPVSGYVARVVAAAGGTTTGTITISVTINNGSNITNGGLTIAAGSNARAGVIYELPLAGAGSTSGVYINEGDCIAFAPSGGGGASVPGAFTLVIRSQS
jgi:hypothetical protein